LLRNSAISNTKPGDRGPWTDAFQILSVGLK